MNNDLISREALKSGVEKFVLKKLANGLSFVDLLTDDVIDKVRAFIDNAPTVETYTKDDMTREYLKGYNACKDMSERPTGEWICVTKSTFPQYQPDEYKCPFCNVIVHRKTNYCEYCGASMKGGKNG